MNLEDKIKNLSEIEYPDKLHNKIMRNLFFFRFKNIFLVIFSVLCFNLIISGWRFWQQFAGNEFVSTMKALWDGFEWSFDFASSFLSTTLSYLPVGSLSIFLINLVLVGYLVRLYFRWERMKIIS